MRARLVLLLGLVAAVAACERSSPVQPPQDVTSDAIDIVPDYAVSPAASVDAAGIGAARFPEELKLTVEQKAAIAALHDAFMKANAADVAALRAIEQEARAAIRAGKTREEVRAILEKGAPILAKLDAAFEKLRADILAVYTPEQRAWIESHKPRGCGPDGVRLTEDQVKQIRALQEQFYASVKADLELLRSIGEEVKTARAAGKSREEIAAILARGADAHRRVAEAERKLQDAILALLTPEQQRGWLCRHR